MNGASRMIGHRVLVDGMMGSGKSTFARALAVRTGLPVIHLDVHYWKPGWVRPSDDEWRERQRALLAGEAWIIDGNYNETLPLRLERAETVIFLDSPWWLCASRAFVRGLRKPVGEMPEGCEDSVNRRLRDEWGGVGRIWRNRGQNLSTHAPRSCGAGLTRRCTRSVRGGRRGLFSMPSAARKHHHIRRMAPIGRRRLSHGARRRVARIPRSSAG